MTSTTKLAIAIDLEQLRELMRELIDNHVPNDGSQTQFEWRFETFLQWLRRKQQEATDGKKPTD